MALAIMMAAIGGFLVFEVYPISHSYWDLAIGIVNFIPGCFFTITSLFRGK